jgi:hypothetical protein
MPTDFLIGEQLEIIRRQNRKKRTQAIQQEGTEP